MDELRYQAAKKLFLDVCDLSEKDQAATIAERCKDDPELRKDVETLLSHHEQEGETVVSGAETVRSPTRRETIRERDYQTVGPYRVVHELGRGGMGVVYLGVRENDQFRRRVAVKVLKRGMDTEEILRRFKLEEQVLASLNHPGIARLYDAGETDDGVPYFAMEYVEGLELQAYCDAHRLNIRERLRLFKKVCTAVHHAHKNLIVHRDLKPSNIIVTEDGQPKLLDFGIAKLINPELQAISGDPTAPEFRVMTPEYASPEQVRGDPITTSSDIYSLGVILYEMVSGHAPYKLRSRVRAELERVVCQEEPERPSTAISRVEDADPGDRSTTTGTLTPESVSLARETRPDRLRRSLAGDIDNIVMMAMRKEPQRRYASAEQLAEDIERHLENMPVIARRDTVMYRTAKFVGRNRVAVAAAALLVMTLLGGVMGTTSGWRAEAERRAEVEEAKTKVEAAKAEVEVQRDVANARVQTLVDISGEMLVGIHTEIQTLDASLKARELLVNTAFEYLDGLAKEVHENDELQAMLALAIDRIADVYGGNRNPSQGDVKLALESYRKAMAIRQALLDAAPDDPDRLRDVSSSYIKIGDMQMLGGDVGAGRASYEEGLRLRKQNLDKDPKSETAQRDYAVSLLTVADAYYLTGDSKTALEYYERSREIREKLAAQHPEDTTHAREVSVIQIRIGFRSMAENDPEEALFRFKEAARIRKRLSEAEPGNSRFRRDLEIAQSFVGEAHLSLGEPDEALEVFDQSFAIARQRSEFEPGNVRATRDVANAQLNLGRAHAMRCDWDEAAKHYDAFHAIIGPLADANPDNTQYRALLAESEMRLGEVLAAQGDLAGAIARGREGLEITEKLALIDEADFRKKRDAALYGLKLGTWLAADGQRREARVRLNRTREQLAQVVEKQPNELQPREGLAEALGALSELSADLGNTDEAVQLAEAAVEAMPEWKPQPKILEVRLLRTLAAAYARTGDRAKAAETAQEALDAHTRVAEPDCDGLKQKVEEELAGYRE